MKPFSLFAYHSIYYRLNLTPDDRSMITEYTGMNPVKADLLSQQIYNRDGALFQASRGQVRNIVLSIYLLRNVEENRAKIIKMFTTGESITLLHTEGDRQRAITGYVETIELDRFAQPQKAKQVIQISIMCYDPWFENPENKTVLSEGDASIEYNGDAPSGMKITFSTNSSSSVRLTLNEDQNIWLDLVGTGTTADDIIVVDTNRHRVWRNNVNFIETWSPESEWLQLLHGENVLQITNLVNGIRIDYNEKYTSIF